MARKYRRRGAATFVNVDRSRIDPAELKKRLAERDRRLAADDRTEAQKWLGASVWQLAPSAKAVGRVLIKMGLVNKVIHFDQTLSRNRR